MKIQAFLKIAVVAMAALGAYSFNGNSNEIDQFSYKNSSVCTDVSVACSNDGDYTFRVKQ